MTQRKGPVAEDLLDRMARKFTVGDGCWQWAGTFDAYGYGYISVKIDGKWRMRKAHRLMYEFLVGPIPDGLTLDHLCRNRGCIRPAHLEPVTRGENVLRGVGPSATAATVMHCPQGHPYDETNTRLRKTPSGVGRVCRKCTSERTIARQKANPEKRAAYRLANREHINALRRAARNRAKEQP